MVVTTDLRIFSLLTLLLLLLFGLIDNGPVEVLSVDQYARDDFPARFVFGSGSSAYQVEGAAFEDGRTPSIWDTFTHAGHSDGSNGDIACDVYHKYKEDVQLMADVGLEAYRFSISWSRLIPNGRGPINPKGLAFYNNFIDELMSHGIEPHVTLVHSDTPQILEDEYGGWLNRLSVKDFVAFADVCFKEFGDRVLHWTTFNEANVFVMAGYLAGILPPNRCSSTSCAQGDSSTEPYIAAHNILLAHASAARLYREKYKAQQHGFIGICLFSYGFFPLTNSTEDVIAAHRAYDILISWFMCPLVFGDYPDIIKKIGGTSLPAFTQIESELVKGSFDFIGLNHYTSLRISSNFTITAELAMEEIFHRDDQPLFPILPSGLQAVLEHFKHIYGNPPMYIHENGQATKRNGTLNDTPRVEYLRAYIGSLLDAIRNGSDTRGYFQWSFLDLFELLEGYKAGYGLYYVDLDDKDLGRYPKLSAYWYSNFLKGKNVSEDVIIQGFEKNKSTSSHSH